MTQTQKIIELLSRKKKVYNNELNKICFRYGARIHELRKMGYTIKTECEGLGFYSFSLISKPNK
jgi:hypothetical protein